MEEGGREEGEREERGGGREGGRGEEGGRREEGKSEGEKEREVAWKRRNNEGRESEGGKKHNTWYQECIMHSRWYIITHVHMRST